MPWVNKAINESCVISVLKLKLRPIGGFGRSWLCGMRNAECRMKKSAPSLLFRIPHSAFRIRTTSPTARRIRSKDDLGADWVHVLVHPSAVRDLAGAGGPPSRTYLH